MTPLVKNDATTLSVSYNRHSYYSRGVICAPRAANCAPREYLQASLITIITYDCHNFIVPATVGVGVNMQPILCNVGGGI
jgi:hypothetical protein